MGKKSKVDAPSPPLTRAASKRKPQKYTPLPSKKKPDLITLSSDDEEESNVKIEKVPSRVPFSENPFPDGLFSNKLVPKKLVAKKAPSVPMKFEPIRKKKPLSTKLHSSTVVPTSTEPALNLRTSVEKLEQWVDKYRPKDIKAIIGQHTDQAPAKKLMRWLKDWPRHNLGLEATKKKGAVGTSSKTDGNAFRAALLSGPPGIGKTTTATVVCEELGLRYIELNASAARSKKILEQKVSQLIHSRRVDEYFGDKNTSPVIKSETGRKITHVLIMDEVDGMNGNHDRAGVAELIKFIKSAEIPIICICNDRYSTKVRSLANYCFDLRFTLPRMEQVLGRMMTIALREKIKVPKGEMEMIIKASNYDVRQTIYSLQLLSAGQKHNDVIQIKDTSINIFEAARQLLTTGTDIRKKRDLFFTDYSMMPLFVQENYLCIRPSNLDRKDKMRALRNAAESIAMGEMVNRQIWATQNWSLLSLQGILSCAIPTLQLNGQLIGGQVAFPSLLGKLSNQGKRLRLLRELDEHMGLKMSGPLHAISTDYIPVIRNAILRPLIRSGSAGVEEVIEIYHAYDLVKEDLESINELGTWNDRSDLWKTVKPAVKASLTRALGKDTHKKHHALLDDVNIQPRKAVGKTTEKRPTAKAAVKKLASEMDKKEGSDEEKDNDDVEVQAEILSTY